MRRAWVCGLLIPCLNINAQYSTYERHNVSGAAPPPATVTFTAWPTTNLNASNGDTPARKQLGNCATGWDGSSLTPVGYPTGQFYCSAAIKAAAEAAGGPVQGFVSTTSSGVGILAMDNGKNAGGTDSPVTVTDTYAANTFDSFCTGDAQYMAMVGTIVYDIPIPPCPANSSAHFGESTAVSHGNSDVLWPISYEDPTQDASLYTMITFHFRPNDVTHLHDLETDYNYNTASTNSYIGPGMHWNSTKHMYQACAQGCSGWTTMKWTPVAGGPAVTAYPLTTGHIYGLIEWLSHTLTCDWTSAVNCYFYDKIMIWDVTAGTVPVLYNITDTLGNRIGGIPIHRPTFPDGLITPQVQIDMTSANASTTVDFDAYVVSLYSK